MFTGEKWKEKSDSSKIILERLISGYYDTFAIDIVKAKATLNLRKFVPIMIWDISILCNWIANKVLSLDLK